MCEAMSDTQLASSGTNSTLADTPFLGSNPTPATNFNARSLYRAFFMPPTYQVYVIQNPAGRFYIGLSENVPNRLEQHNAGVSTWTRHRGPWLLIWTSAPQSLTDARKLENRLKAQKGGAGFRAITGLGATPDSAAGS